MLKHSVILAALVLLPGAALADNLGSVTKVLRPQVRSFDAQGQPLGPVSATDIKVPAPIVGYGVGHTRPRRADRRRQGRLQAGPGDGPRDGLQLCGVQHGPGGPRRL